MGRRAVTPDGGDGPRRGADRHYHVFAKPLVLTKLAHFLMDMHREDGKWTGTKSRPLVLLAEKPVPIPTWWWDTCIPRRRATS